MGIRMWADAVSTTADYMASLNKPFCLLRTRTTQPKSGHWLMCLWRVTWLVCFPLMQWHRGGLILIKGMGCKTHPSTLQCFVSFFRYCNSINCIMFCECTEGGIPMISKHYIFSYERALSYHMWCFYTQYSLMSVKRHNITKGVIKTTEIGSVSLHYL